MRLGKFVSFFFICLPLNLWGNTFTQRPFGSRPEWCTKLLRDLNQKEKEKVTAELKTLDDLLWAFTSGLIPNSDQFSQVQAFEIYLRQNFGDATRVHNLPSVLNKIARLIKVQQDITKPVLRNYRLSFVLMDYPVTEELASVLETPLEAVRKAREHFFQIESHLDYWRQVFDKKSAVVARELPKDERLARLKAEKEKFLSFLNKIIPADFRRELQFTDSKLPPQEKVQQLFNLLKIYREKRIQRGADVSAVSQAMVDLVHVFAFHDSEIRKNLKSSDGMERINSFRKALEARDALARNLGYKNQFTGLLRVLGIPSPTGMKHSKEFMSKLKQIEEDILSKAVERENAHQSKEVRHLSLMESPFRSCIGGDCSSNTYLEKGLDPNYQYFTLTDPDGRSDGQITVVLGTLKAKKGKSRKIAFVDKIQNVPSELLQAMLEGIRRSVKTRDYELALPAVLGFENGISNTPETRRFIKNNIQTSKESLSGFKPHANKTNFVEGHSRANDGLAIKIVTPYDLPQGVRLNPVESTRPWSLGNIDLAQLVQGSHSLKEGGIEDKLRYINAEAMIKRMDLGTDPLFEGTLDNWLGDPNASLKLRKRALRYGWLEAGRSLPPLVSGFSPIERVDIVQNILDTPKLRDEILRNYKKLPDLIAQIRHNSNLVKTLAETFSVQKADIIGRVAISKDIDALAVAQLINQIELDAHSQNMSRVINIIRRLSGKSSEKEVRELLAERYSAKVFDPSRLLGEIVRHLTDPDMKAQEFAKIVLARVVVEGPISVRNGIEQLTSFTQGGSLSLREASELWISDRNQKIESKSTFLSYYLTSPQFESLAGKLPENQRAEVLSLLQKNSQALFFREIALKNGFSKEALSLITPESFEFKSFDISREGVKVRLGSPLEELGRGEGEDIREVTLTNPFQMQATPVTNFQYGLYLASTRKSSSEIMNVRLKNPNEPYVGVTRSEALNYLRWLNRQDPSFEFRLPTDAEREFATRAGTQTRYWSGDQEADLALVGWYKGNSGGRLHEVAELPANPVGLFDMLGNVAEWCEDRYTDDSSKRGTINPVGPGTGFSRVLRGGTFRDEATEVRSASIAYLMPEVASLQNGFRVVRTKKHP